MKEQWIPKVGDKVYHRGLDRVGIITITGEDYAGSSSSTVVMFDDIEMEVSIHFLVPFDPHFNAHKEYTL